MRRAHTVEQVRTAEAAAMADLPDGMLMQRAATGLAYAVIDFLGGAYGRRVVLLVGSGDNGGDALYAGALLARRGAAVEAWLLSERAHPGGVAALRAAGGRVVGGLDAGSLALARLDHRQQSAVEPPSRQARRVETLDEADHSVIEPPTRQARRVETSDRREAAWSPAPTEVVTTADSTGQNRQVDVVVDGITGIGGRPGLRPEAVAALEALRGVPVVAVDVPSGVDVDTGELAGPHVTADLTVTFGTHKVAHLVDPAARACGVVHLVDLGLDLPPAPVEALQPEDVAALLPRPADDAHKYTRGVVGVRAGSERYPGAALLAVAGANTGLAGMVRYVGSAEALVRQRHPEVVGAGRVQAWVVGPGGAENAGGQLTEALADGVPAVVDADALAHVHRPVPVPLILTPHAGELAAMLGAERSAVESRPLHHARRAAEEYAAVVLLKGRHTLIADPAGRVRVTTAGTPWLATAGAGDVLSGVIGALLAAGLAPFDAASVGSWLHGAAATLAARGGPITAGRVAEEVPHVVRSLAMRD